MSAAEVCGEDIGDDPIKNGADSADGTSNDNEKSALS